MEIRRAINLVESAQIDQSRLQWETLYPAMMKLAASTIQTQGYDDYVKEVAEQTDDFFDDSFLPRHHGHQQLG